MAHAVANRRNSTPTRPTTTPTCDGGYATAASWFGIARKGIETSKRLGTHRWVIERTVAWLFGYRRLNTRYERKANHFSAFLTLAATLTCYKKLTK